MDNPIKPGSAPAGSPNVPAPAPAPGTPAGQTNMTGGDNGKNYDELLARFGKQGEELGEFRKFFTNISPLLDKLDPSPELVQAIVDGKLDGEIAKAVLEGRVDIRDAAIVQQAAEVVKENLGEKKFELATPESIQKLIETQVGKLRKEIEEKADVEAYQNQTQQFMAKTTDFKEYAEAIDKWLDTHDVDDIEVAYYAVKGQMSETKAKEAADIAQAERAKEVLGNAQGGGQSSQYAQDGTPLIDKLVQGRPNANSFWQNN